MYYEIRVSEPQFKMRFSELFLMNATQTNARTMEHMKSLFVIFALLMPSTVFAQKSTLTKDRLIYTCEVQSVIGFAENIHAEPKKYNNQFIFYFGYSAQAVLLEDGKYKDGYCIGNFHPITFQETDSRIPLNYCVEIEDLMEFVPYSPCDEEHCRQDSISMGQFNLDRRTLKFYAAKTTHQQPLFMTGACRKTPMR
jgi:hypothetical protein